MQTTYLYLDFSLPADLFAIRAIAPSLDKVPMASVSCQLYVRRYGRLLSDGEVGARLWCGRRTTECVGFPLEGVLVSVWHLGSLGL